MFNFFILIRFMVLSIASFKVIPNVSSTQNNLLRFTVRPYRTEHICCSENVQIKNYGVLYAKYESTTFTITDGLLISWRRVGNRNVERNFKLHALERRNVVEIYVLQCYERYGPFYYINNTIRSTTHIISHGRDVE